MGVFTADVMMSLLIQLLLNRQAVEPRELTKNCQNLNERAHHEISSG